MCLRVTGRLLNPGEWPSEKTVTKHPEHFIVPSPGEGTARARGYTS